jgi:pyruvate ferredoxin oxidoreductase gamma subunit
MVEIRWHGRGGQGAKTAAQLAAMGFMAQGRFVQAFPEYGPERTGAPVLAYTRVDESPIRIHSAIRRPDIAVVLDPSLLHDQPVARGLDPERGLLIVNTGRTERPIPIAGYQGNVLYVPADAMALAAGTRHGNTVLVGVLAAWLGEPSLEALTAAGRQLFTRLPAPAREAALKAMEAGYRYSVAPVRASTEPSVVREVNAAHA